MSISLDHEYHHEYGVVEQIKETPSSLSPRKLSLQFCLYNIFRSSIDNPFVLLPEQRQLSLEVTMEFHIDFLKSNEMAQNFIPDILSILKVPKPYHAQIIDSITSVARSILSKAKTKKNATGSTATNNYSIMVAIATVTSKVYTHEEYEAMVMVETAAMEAEQFRPIPATKSSFEALERVVLDDFGSMQECIICMEEFQVGLEVTRMPCSHIYHGECIVEWLETSHMCPLCRFPMPHEI